MAYVGGSLLSISIAGNPFVVSSDNDVTRVLGGWSNTVESNGDGSVRNIKKRIPWSLKSVDIAVDDVAGTQDLMQSLIDAVGPHSITATYADGTVYSGTGVVTEDAEHKNQSGTMTISMSGPGKLSRQA